MSHLCLRHLDASGIKHLRLMPSEKAEELFKKAKRGDTLHQVTEDARFDIYLLHAQLDDQLAHGQFITMP